MIELPEGSWWDWEVHSWNGVDLHLVAGPDLTYGYGLELVFTETDYVSCPAAFHDAAFREPAADETGQVKRLFGDDHGLIFAFEADAATGERVACLIVAAAVKVRQGFVRR